ncbi:hypothetical protein ACLKA7_003761 [Drosophila subpalustris]
MNTAKNTAELKPKTKAKRKPSFDVATTVEDKQREEQQAHQEEKEQQGHAAAMRLSELLCWCVNMEHDIAQMSPWTLDERSPVLTRPEKEEQGQGYP